MLAILSRGSRRRRQETLFSTHSLPLRTPREIKCVEDGLGLSGECEVRRGPWRRGGDDATPSADNTTADGRLATHTARIFTTAAVSQLAFPFRICTPEHATIGGGCSQA